VDVFDVHRGRLALRVALPEQPKIPKTPSLAVDETSSKVFILTRSGLSVAEIAVVPLSIASVNPASGASESHHSWQWFSERRDSFVWHVVRNRYLCRWHDAYRDSPEHLFWSSASHGD
jgi:hypothetical protein